MVQFLKIHQYNPLYNESEKNHMIIPLNADKAIPIPLHAKTKQNKNTCKQENPVPKHQNSMK